MNDGKSDGIVEQEMPGAGKAVPKAAGEVDSESLEKHGIVGGVRVSGIPNGLL